MTNLEETLARALDAQDAVHARLAAEAHAADAADKDARLELANAVLDTINSVHVARAAFEADLLRRYRSAGKPPGVSW